MSEAALQLQDVIAGIVQKESRRQVEAFEKHLRDDLRLIGIDPELILNDGRVPDRITVAQQRTSDGGYVYRGLILDGDLVIDHCWQQPFDGSSEGIRRRLIGFVFAGRNEERMAWAREHSLDQRVVLPADPERVRGVRNRLIYVTGETAYDAPLHHRDNYLQAKRLVEMLNRSNQWPAVSPYGE